MKASQHRTKADLAEAHVRDLVLSGRLAPGEHVRMTHVAREIGVSDIPVREAVARLTSQGLLRHEPHKGVVVTEIGPHEVRELFAIRAELEGLAMQLAADALDEDQLVRIEGVLEQMEAAEADGRASDYHRINRTFHMSIYDAQPYKQLTKMIRELWDSSSRCGTIFRADSSTMQDSAAEHRRMFEALAARDGRRARAVLEEQKRRACAWLLEHVERSDQQPAPV